jgi:sigma-B regulation protein RsbU (phosphoserine phosphatase)
VQHIPADLKEFLDQIPGGLFITDAERRIVFWNRAAREIAGFSAEDLLGKTCFEADSLSYKTLSGEDICGEERCPVFESIFTNKPSTLPRILLMNSMSGKPVPVSLSVGPLSDASGELVGTVGMFHDMQKEYRQRKLALEIQRSSIFKGDMSRGLVRVQTHYDPVEEIGGDYLEAFFLDDGTLIATLADATGHGMSAALFTMVFKTLLHAAFAKVRAPREVLDEVNRGFLRLGGIEGYYISACLVRYDPRAREGAYAAAGHPEGLIFGSNGKAAVLRRKLHLMSFMLGIEEDTRYEEAHFSLAPGEFLLLASDGVFESECYNGKAFGVPGIERFFSLEPPGRPLAELAALVKEENKNGRPSDDMSILAITALRENTP